MRPLLDLDDEFSGEVGEQLALTVTCPNPQCAAAIDESCRPYTHWVRVRRALLSWPAPVEQNV
jgi:hypothetical protein